MLFILNKSYEVVGNLSLDGDLTKLTTYFDDVYEQDLTTGAETFEFSTLANTEQAQHLVVGNFISFKEDGKFKLFNIINIEETHEDVFIKKIYCEMASIELINEIIRPMKVLNSSLTKFVNTILEGTEWQLGVMDISFNQVQDFEIKDYKSVYSLLQEYAVGLYSAELSYRVEISHGKIIGKYIDFYAQRGKDNGARFEYGSNLTSVVKTVDTSNLATALIGVGNSNITFKEVDTDDKPLNQDFIASEEAYFRWNVNGSHIFGIHKADTDSPQELLRLTRLALKERSNPQVKYEMKVELLDNKVAIGDTVYIVDHEFNPPLYLSARVSQLKTHKNEPTKDEVVLSNYKELVSNITPDMRAIASELEGYIEGKFPIGGDQIKDDAINGSHLQQNIITGTHIMANSITADKITAGSIEAEHIAANAITADKIMADSINAEHITANSVKAEHITANSVNSEHIAAGSIVAGSTIIADGAIGSAQISDLHADKITGGTIETSKVDISGAGGNLLIRGNRLQVFEGHGNDKKERVSLGDVNNDGSIYGLRVRGKDGVTVLLDENGVTGEGITDGSIKNEHISGETKIDGYKLNIDSVVREINGATETINGTKIDIEGTNLGAQLSEIVKTQSEQEQSISNNTTKIQANQNAIKLKVDEQKYTSDINGINKTLENQSAQIEVNKNEISTKVSQSWVKEQGYQTGSEIKQTVDQLEMKFTQGGGYNLVYNGDFKKGLESWAVNTSSGITYVSQGLSCKNGRGVRFNGEQGTTKQINQYNIDATNVGENITVSYYTYVSSSGADGTTNPYRQGELSITYEDGTMSWHGVPSVTEYDVWQKRELIVNVSERPTKLSMGLYCRDTTKVVYYSQVMVEKGSVANEWSPNPNEICDGITKIDRDGITVSSTNSNTHTVMDSSSFRVENNQGGTVAEFSNNSTIPNLTAGVINATEIYAPNVASVSKRNSTDYVRIYVDSGASGDDNNTGQQGSPFKTISRAIQEIETIENRDIAILISGNHGGFDIIGHQGAGELKIFFESTTVINGDIRIYGVTSRLVINGTDRKSVIKGTVYLKGCNNVEIGWIAFRSDNKRANNIDIYKCSTVVVRINDLGHLTSGGSCIKTNFCNGLWVYDNWGSSNISNYVETIGYTTIYLERSGNNRACPDYTTNMIYYNNDGNTSQSFGDANYKKTASAGWNPVYTPTQRKTTWNFNKIWSDETRNGWSNRNELIQGYSSTYDTGRWTGYLQMTDGMASIKSAISDSTNLSGRVYVQRKTSSGADPGTCCMYASDGTHIANKSMARGAGAWFTLSSAVVTKIMNGTITYFYLKNDADNINTYMKMETLGKIEITYTK